MTHHKFSTSQKPKKVNAPRAALSPAFTIVELLIVIVIIAILAAITIISYVGIQNRAKASAAQTLLSQTVSKVKLYAVDHSDTYPSSLSDAGITNTDGLQYSSSSSSPSTFCITATSQNVSYYQSSTTTAPTAGACPGHGVNGGEVVVNLWKDPSVTTVAGFNCGGGGTFSILNTGGYSGSQFMRGTVGATCGSASAGPFFAGINIAPGKTYTASAYVRTSRSLSFRAIIEWELSDGSHIAGTNAYGNYVTTNDSSWVRVSSTGTAPANAGLATITVYGSMSAGDSVDVDAIMFTEGSAVYAYTDPTINSSWVWTGTANNSTSSGPTP